MIAALGALSGAFMLGRRLLSGQQSLDVEMDMRQGLYSHLVRLSFGFYDRHQTGQLMSRATVDLQGVRFFLGYGLIFFFQNILTVISVSVVLFFVEWKLALIVLAITPLLVALAYRYSRIAHPTLRDVQQKLADVATVAEENIVGVHVVKAFAQEPAEEAKFARAQRGALRADDPREPAARDVRAAALLPAAPRAGGRPALRRADGRARHALGRLASSPSTSTSAWSSCRCAALGMWIGQAQRATASGERIFQVLDEPEEVADSPAAVELPAGDGEIRFEDVSFEYLAGRPVLEHLDLAARRRHDRSRSSATPAPARRRSPRSSPASTTSTAGRVLVDGVDVRDVTLDSLRREIGVIPQDPFLFSTTVRENIAFGRPEMTDDEVERVARLAQAHEFVERLPQGYETVIGERGITLSGGQRQRIAIARALARRPAHPHPRRRDRVGRRDDGGADPQRPARGHARPDDADHRAPALDDRARRRDRRPRRRPDRGARHARRAARDERRSTARSTSTACSSGSSPTPSRRAPTWRRSHEQVARSSRRAPACGQRGARSRTGRGTRRAGGSACSGG